MPREKPRAVFGTLAGIAGDLGIDEDLIARTGEATRAAIGRGDPMPSRRVLGVRPVVHGGALVPVVLYRQTMPPWLLELDSEFLAVTYSAVAEGRLGQVVGTGETLDEALRNVRHALKLETRLIPRGQG
jgi:hypothetical protein